MKSSSSSPATEYWITEISIQIKKFEDSRTHWAMLSHLQFNTMQVLCHIYETIDKIFVERNTKRENKCNTI